MKHFLKYYFWILKFSQVFEELLTKSESQRMPTG